MKIFITILFGSSFSLDVDGSDTISTIKRMIPEKKRSLSPDEYVLMFNGAILEDENALSDYKIAEESILQLKYQFNNTTQDIIEEMNRDLDQVKQYREENSSKIKQLTNDFAETCQTLKNREEDWNEIIDLCVKEMETDYTELYNAQEQDVEDAPQESKFVRPSDDYDRSGINIVSSRNMSNFGDTTTTTERRSEAVRQQYDPSLTTYNVEDTRASNEHSLTSVYRSANDTFLRDDCYAGRCSGSNAANACSSQSNKENTVSAEVLGYYGQAIATKEEDDEKTLTNGGELADELSHVDKTDEIDVAVEKDDDEKPLTDNGCGGNNPYNAWLSCTTLHVKHDRLDKKPYCKSLKKLIKQILQFKYYEPTKPTKLLQDLKKKFNQRILNRGKPLCEKVYEQPKLSFIYLLCDAKLLEDACIHCDFYVFIFSIFYVGKGCGFRPFNHFKELFKVIDEIDKRTSKEERIIDLLNGRGVTVVKLCDFVTEDEAFVHEASLMFALEPQLFQSPNQKCQQLTNVSPGTFKNDELFWSDEDKIKLGVYNAWTAWRVYQLRRSVPVKFDDLPKSREDFFQN